MMIETVGVIGAGQMGSGIAEVCVRHGYDVLLHDVSGDRIEAGLGRIRANLERQVARRSLCESAVEPAMARISPALGVPALCGSDLIIEAATENEALKLAILQSLEPHLKPEAIVASNTSSISITRLAAVTARPDQFIGLHFMNPVPVMKLVEVIRGIATSEAAYNAVTEFARTLGKQTTNSEDYPGFLVNRALIPMINEAVYVLYEGVGGVAAIDTALKLGANHPMGPLELADFIGLDTVLSIMTVLHEGFGDSKYRPCPLLVKYVEAGWLGRKTQRGFYDYRHAPPTPTR